MAVAAVAFAVPLADGMPSPGEAGVHVAGPRLRAVPFRVHRGGVVVLHGRGFPQRARIALRVRRPHHPAAVRLGAARTGRRGAFDAPIRIDADARLGRYTALACHDRCRVRATVRFRIVRR